MERELNFKQTMILSIFIFSLLGLIFLIGWWNSSERQLSKMDKVVVECKTAAMNQDFSTAHEKINILRSEGSDSQYNEAFDYVFNAEALYLCAKGDQESMNRIIFLLSGIPMDGLPAFSEGANCEALSPDQTNMHDKYIESTRRFNLKCDALIDIAIAYHKYSIVENVIPLYKSVPDQINFFSVMVYSSQNKEDAIKKVNKAIDDGAFPNVTEHIK